MFKYSSVPAYTFKKSQSQSRAPQQPGPGSYDPSFNFVENSHNLSLKYSREEAKTLTREGTTLPGPGAYGEPKLDSGKLYSFSRRDRFGNEKGKNGLDPGSYEPLEAFKKVRPSEKQFHFSKEDRSHKQPNSVPGPGAYTVSPPTLDRKGGFIPKGVSQNFGKKGLNLGPGQYEIPPVASLNKGISFVKSEKALNMAKEGLGPGQYETCHDPFKTNKQVYIGKSRRMFQKSDKIEAIGPGAYNIQSETKTGGFSFPKNEREGNAKGVSPGPGAYDKKGLAEEKKVGGFIGQSTQKLSKKEVPDPGAYDSKIEVYDKKGAFIGKENRFKQKIDNIPGPGKYDKKIDEKCQSFFFEKSVFKPKKTENPAVGTYDLNYNAVEKKDGGGKFWRRDLGTHMKEDQGKFYDIPHSIPDVPKYNYPDKSKLKIHL